MVRRVLALGLAFGVGFFAVAVSAADPDKPADWSGWTTVGVWTGEVSKLSKKTGAGFSVSSTTTTLTPGGGGRRPTPKTTTKSTEVMLAEGALVRWAKLPPKLDEKGKRVPRTEAEVAESRKPGGVKGYAADPSDLKPGQYVEVTMVRPRNVPAKDVQFSDLRAKLVVIVGENPNPPPDQPAPKKKAKAKN